MTCSETGYSTPVRGDYPDWLDPALARAFGEERTADIASQKVEQGRLILQGIQNGNAWSLTVSQESGVMSLAIAGDGVAVTAFGVCEAY